MNSTLSKKRVEKLNKIKEVLKISKFTTLQEIQKTAKVSSDALEIALISQEIFNNVHKKYHINSRFHKAHREKGTLFVFITFPKNFLSISYAEHIKAFKNVFNPSKDFLITFGDIAKSFVEKEKIEVQAHFDDDNKIAELASTISVLFEEKAITAVKFISHSTSDEEKIRTIIPIEDFRIANKVFNHDFSKIKFFPSLPEIMENISEVYILQITRALYNNAKYFYLKEKLIQHENAIESVDESILQTNREVSKYERAIQTEELVMIHQNSKRVKGGEYNE